MSKSKARFLAELLGADGTVKEDKSALDISGGKITLSELPEIPNSKLAHSSITLNGGEVSLGGSHNLDLQDIVDISNISNTHIKLQDNAWYWTQFSAETDQVRFNANNLGGLDIYNQTQTEFAQVRLGSIRFSSAGEFINSAKVTNWDTAYGWGDHSTEGYLTENTLAAGVGNITTSGYLRGPATFTIDPAAHGDDTGKVVIAGDLQVDGTTTTINSTTVAIDDKNIVLADNAANASAANGAGITINGANASITYNSADDNFVFNKPIKTTQFNGNGTITLAPNTNNTLYKMLDIAESGAYGNGVVTITPRTIPGSGTASQITHFKDNYVDGRAGNTNHKVLFDNDVYIGTMDADHGHTNGDDGIRLSSSGFAMFTRNSSYATLYVNKLNNSGSWADFHKDGTKMGILGVTSNTEDIYFTAPQAGTGIYLNGNGILPASGTGSPNNNAIDLGQSGVRWRDLYLGRNANIDGDVGVAGNVVVNSNNSSAAYLRLNIATGGDGGILFERADVLKWQNFNTQTDNLSWYSYGASSVVMSLTQDGSLDFSSTAQIGRNISDNFTLNGKNQPHYGFNLDPTGGTPVGMSGYYGISFATLGYERLKIEQDGTVDIGGDLLVNGDLKMSGTDSYIWTPNTGNGFTGIWDANNGRVVFRYNNNTQVLDIPTTTVAKSLYFEDINSTPTSWWGMYAWDNSFQITSRSTETLGPHKATVLDINYNTNAVTLQGDLLNVGASAYKASIGSVNFSWDGSTSYPTLYGSHADRWVMITFPHIPFLRNGTRGYTGASVGSIIRYEGDTDGSPRNWDAGVFANHVDKWSVGEAGYADPYFSIDINAIAEFTGRSADWSTRVPGISKGSIHLRPGTNADNHGCAITWGSSDNDGGNRADAGIYVRTDGQYGTKMYIATTDSYASGSKTAIEINNSGQVIIPRNYLLMSQDIRFSVNGESDYSNIIRSVGYPSQGYNISTQRYWIEFAAKGGQHFVLNTDGGSGASENSYDHFTIWQGAVDGTRLFYCTNVGNVWIKSSLTEASSIRYKENISTITGALDTVNALRGVYYNRIDTPDEPEIGLVAEEVAKVVPQLATVKDGQVEGVKYSKTVALLVEAIKELTARVEELENGKN